MPYMIYLSLPNSIRVGNRDAQEPLCTSSSSTITTITEATGSTTTSERKCFLLYRKYDYPWSSRVILYVFLTILNDNAACEDSSKDY